MKIGCPKEIKPQEFRVGMTPHAVREAVAHGHDVIVEKNAGVGAGFSDADYVAAGAKIIDTAEEVSIYEAGGVLQRFAQDFLAAAKSA